MLRITARGSNTYAFLAPFVCESSTVHLLHGKFSREGAHSPGAILEAQEVLKRRRTDLGNSKLCSLTAHNSSFYGRGQEPLEQIVADATLCRAPMTRRSRERVARSTATCPFRSQGVRPHIVVDPPSMSAFAITREARSTRGESLAARAFGLIR